MAHKRKNRGLIAYKPRITPHRETSTGYFFENTLVAAIGRFLTADAEWGPGYRLQTAPLDFFAAVHANSEAPIADSPQSQFDAAAHCGFAIQTRDRHFSGGLVLGLLQLIGTAFDRDALQTQRLAREFNLLGSQQFSKSCQN